MKLEKPRVTIPATWSRRVVTSVLSLLLFMCVAVRPLPATLVHVQGPPVLQPGAFCSDPPDAAIATFEDAELEAEIRDALRESVGAQKDLTCGLISGLTLLDASRGGITSLVGIQNLTGLTILELDDNRSITDISALSGLTSLKRLRLSSNSITDISARHQNRGYTSRSTPGFVYLASPGSGSRRTMRQALDVMAGLVSGGVLNAEAMRWDALRYTHSTAVRAFWPSVTPPQRPTRCWPLYLGCPSVIPPRSRPGDWGVYSLSHEALL